MPRRDYCDAKYTLEVKRGNQQSDGYYVTSETVHLKCSKPKNHEFDDDSHEALLQLEDVDAVQLLTWPVAKIRIPTATTFYSYVTTDSFVNWNV